MRKVLLALGTIAALAGGARADDTASTQETIATDEESKEMRIHRYVFDAMGQDAELDEACRGQRAQRVEVRRTAGDVAAAIFTLGWYTPVHVRVNCGSR